MKAKPTPKRLETRILNSTVLIAALGYFVDIYDLLLFGIVRVSSLKEIGVQDTDLLEVGVYLINMQMIGMLIGGILWGIIGDKRGRVSVLFGSILLYSLANILNAFVDSVMTYGVLRFLAGLGLAGELGAAVTLVSETMTKEKRGLGTTFVAAIGILGAVAAGIVGEVFHWKTAYLIGGGMGLLLLLLRLSVLESGLFENTKKNGKTKMGEVSILFSSPARFFRYLRCILIGVPIWFVIGILITFSPELSKALGIEAPIEAGKAILFCYMGLSLGDLASGYLSQTLQSRRKVLGGFIGLTFALICIYLTAHSLSVSYFYLLCGALGFATGYWAVFITIAAEQFGTNIRATVTTTVPNFVRGSVVLLTSLFQYFLPQFGLLQSAAIVGTLSIAVAFLSLFWMEETFGKDLDFAEAH